MALLIVNEGASWNSNFKLQVHRGSCGTEKNGVTQKLTLQDRGCES